jgi:membrane associated rhomboid family serine protease
VLQFINGFGAVASTSDIAGVADMAHIGGFVAGLALVKLLASRRSHQVLTS